jgi:hypothetical protein
VNVVLHDHPRIHFEPLVLLAIGERVRENLSARHGREDRQPGDHRGGDEVRPVGLIHWIAVPHAELEATAEHTRLARWNTCSRLRPRRATQLPAHRASPNCRTLGTSLHELRSPRGM